MKSYWIIIKDVRKFNGKELVYSKKEDWTSKLSEQEHYKTYQKAYAVCNKLKDAGISCRVVKMEYVEYVG